MYSALRDRGLQIIAVPCNQFASEEPWPEEQIKDWLTSQFSITFPLLAKVEVIGDNVCPLYKNLKAQAPTEEIKWNFAKYLLDGRGKFVKFFADTVEPRDMLPDIEELLNRQQD